MIDLDTREIPEEGLALEGEITDDIFQLPEGDSVSPAGPVTYKARAYLIDGDLVVEGDFSASFEAECVRCLEKFVLAVKLQAHELTENLENPTEADLTQALREDILLALPAYPHCEEGKIPRKCPAEGQFDTSERPPIEDETGESGGDAPNPWAELDNIDGLDSKSD